MLERLNGNNGRNLDRAVDLPVVSLAEIYFAAGACAGPSTAWPTETFIGSEVVVTGVTATPGVPLRMRAQATGTAPTTIRVRVWPASATEPSTWQVTRTNSEPVLQSPGSVGLMGYVSGTATNAPVTFSFDNFEIRRG